MQRILLLVGTNLAILFVLNIVLQLFGIEDWLHQSGSNLNITGLLIISLIFGFSGSFISLALSKTIAKRTMGVKIIEQPSNQNEEWLLNTVAAQAERAGIGMPEVGIFDSMQPNAFATGMSRNNSLVAVSKGLLMSMDADQVEAVLGHEVSHIANGDMVTLTLIQGVLNTFVIFFSRVIGHIVDRVILKSRGYSIGYFMTVLFAQMVLGVLASIVVMWFSRRREFRADYGGAVLAGRDKMIAALQRLQAKSEEKDLPKEMAAFGISGSVGRSLSRRLFSSHPPIEDRISALKNIEL